MIQRAVELIEKSLKPVVFTGAGMSSESGMRTFRGENGLWKEYSPEKLSSIQGLMEDPKAVWDWYRMRFMRTEGVAPHAGYIALTALQGRKGSLPVITQNVDGLHREAGHTDVLEIHGSMRTASCMRKCGFSTILDHGLLETLPPICPSCGSIMKPDIVLFGEPLPHEVITRAYHLAEECDVMLVIGTSVQVWPAAGIPFAALEAGAHIIEVNPSRTELPRSERVISIRRKAGEILPLLTGALQESK